jgi:hypothetical protein
MTDLLVEIASLGVSVLIAAAIIRIVSPLVLDFRPNDLHIVKAVVVAEMASYVLAAVVALFWRPVDPEVTVVVLLFNLVPGVIVDALSINAFVRDPQGNRMGFANASLLAIILAAFGLVIFSVVMIWSKTPLRVW